MCQYAKQTAITCETEKKIESNSCAEQVYFRVQNNYRSLDSGYTALMSASKNYFKNFKELYKTLNLANNKTTEITVSGNIKISVKTNNNENKFKIAKVMF